MQVVELCEERNIGGHALHDPGGDDGQATDLVPIEPEGEMVQEAVLQVRRCYRPPVPLLPSCFIPSSSYCIRTVLQVLRRMDTSGVCWDVKELIMTTIQQIDREKQVYISVSHTNR
jgi:hypothetical protein